MQPRKDVSFISSRVKQYSPMQNHMNSNPQVPRQIQYVEQSNCNKFPQSPFNASEENSLEDTPNENLYIKMQELYKQSRNKKKIFISPNKIIQLNRGPNIMNFKQQIDKLKVRNTPIMNESPFSSAIEDLSVYSKFNNEIQSNNVKLIPIKNSITSKTYKPSQSKSSKRQPNLKPLSQIYIKTPDNQFLSVEKIKTNDKKYYSAVEVYKKKRQQQPGNFTCIKVSNFKKDELQPVQYPINPNVELARTVLMQQKRTSIQKQIGVIKNSIQFEEELIEKEKESSTENKPEIFKTRKIITVIHPQSQTRDSFSQTLTKISPEKPVGLKPRRKKFNPPFETYYYRDWLWKVNYSNNRIWQIPLEYQHRLKVFIGKGNNSSLVRGLIKRRFWMAVTQKIQQANFVFTQLKMLNYFKKQIIAEEQSNKPALLKTQYLQSSILNLSQHKVIQKYREMNNNSEERTDERFLGRQKYFRKIPFYKEIEIRSQKMHNHLRNNYILGNKKALFNTMSNYYGSKGLDVFEYLPLTFHITGLEDQKYYSFLKYYYKRQKSVKAHNNDQSKIKGIKRKQHNAWIVKPGQFSNRGKGIQLCLSLEEIKAILKKKQIYQDGTYRTYIVQQYIQRPFLYYKRKFDLRHYMMISCVNGLIKGYWYKQGYIRTTSSQYNFKSTMGKVHLTNDAVQKALPQYGKYQKGNKLSYEDFQLYLDKYHKGLNFYQQIYPKMKSIAIDAIRASSGSIDPEKHQNNFEIFGLDFMIDHQFQTWLIQINTNPCLEISCPLLGSIIPKMIQNTLQLTLDSQFPPPSRFSPKGVIYTKNIEMENQYQLVYDERIEGLYQASQKILDAKLLQEEEDTFEDDGDQWDQD